jgi:hypothetical protein
VTTIIKLLPHKRHSGKRFKDFSKHLPAKVRKKNGSGAFYLAFMSAFAPRNTLPAALLLTVHGYNILSCREPGRIAFYR